MSGLLDNVEVGDAVLCAFASDRKWLKVIKVLKNTVRLERMVELSKKTMRETGRQSLFSPLALEVRKGDL
jgi:hypothetical protein